MVNANAFFVQEELSMEPSETFDFDELEEKLQNQADEELAELNFLQEEYKKIGNPENLGTVIKDVVWEQFLNQVAVTAGEDFIKENRGLRLDLRAEAHIQTAENFENGKIATHNAKIDYQKRYDDWQSKFAKDENGNIKTYKSRSGKEEAILVSGARDPYDHGRPSGSQKSGTDMDHTISAGEMIRDPSANAFLTEKERVDFANSEVNLNEMPSSHNRSKGDKTMSEWLDNPNSKGQKPNEIFDDLTPEVDKKYREIDAEARKAKEEMVKKAEEEQRAWGRKSQREEAFRIGKAATKAVLMQLLAELLREIIAKLVKWFKSSKRSLENLWNHLKESIESFVGNMKQHLINAADTLFTTVATAILGPIMRTIKKVWMMLKQGWKSFKDAINYIRDPANKGKSISILMMEVGKILIGGLTAAGAIVLSDFIEKGLMAFPIFAIEIPLLGSLASILGIFLGAVVSGIIGAIAINSIEKIIANSKKEKLQMQIVAQSEVVTEVKVAQNYASLGKAYQDLQDNAKDAKENLYNAAQDIYQSGQDVDKELDSFNGTLDRLRKLRNK